MKSKKIIDILIIITLCIMCFSGYKVYSDIKESRESRKQFENLQNSVSVPENTSTPLTAAERYAPLTEANDHFTGWISIDGTQLNYPVMQTKNDPEYYLRRDFTKKYNYHGVPFMDYRCTRNESDNIIIYSHNMKDGSMFHAAEEYMSPSFYENHKYINFDTLNGYGLYEVVCVFKTDVSSNSFAYYDAINFETEEEFNSFILTAKSKAPYNTGVSAEFGDELITLSTCEYTMEDGRCVLIAKKIQHQDIKYFDQNGNEIK